METATLFIFDDEIDHDSNCIEASDTGVCKVNFQSGSKDDKDNINNSTFQTVQRLNKSMIYGECMI